MQTRFARVEFFAFDPKPSSHAFRHDTFERICDDWRVETDTANALFHFSGASDK
jgi:hypothetical protein